MQFDGVDDFVRVPRSVSLEPTSEITIEMWAFLDGAQNRNCRLLRKAGHLQSGYLFALDQVGDRRIQLRIDYPRTIRAVDSQTYSSYAGTWHHFAGVYSPTHVSLYIDGVEIATRRHNGGELAHSPFDLYIGYGEPSSNENEHFRGKIDEVRIWKVARTEDQIRKHMHRRLTGKEPGLVGYWNFDEGKGNVARDISPHGNHGRLEHGPDSSGVRSVQRLGKPVPLSKGTALQKLIEAAGPGETVVIPEGVYTEPITITKPVVLKGQSQAGCVFEVTANRPAILIDTRGKGRVILEGVTIRWQLATSDKGTKHPWAVGVKDTKAEIRHCRFVPLGNFRRSPVAVRAMGFSNVLVNACRFDGFEYVISYAQGTGGTVQDSLIMDCGHQGVMLYSGATVRIVRNVITGSRYHAVRSTGGTLHLSDNLIIENHNRGVYLGNKSARGTISNNVIAGNGTGISGFGRSTVKIENNLILDSSYAGIGMRNSCRLSIRNNIFQGNQRGWSLFEDKSKAGNTAYRNTFWQNKVDTENFDKTANSIAADPRFVDPANGDFSLKPGPALEHKQGLTNPKIFKALWERWKGRNDKQGDGPA